MSDFIRLSNIFKKLGIKQSSNYMMSMILSYNLKPQDLISKQQKGGNKILEERESKNVKMEYNSVTYNFYSYHDGEFVYYHLEENEIKCVTIIINKELSFAIIYEVNCEYRCFPINMNGKEKSGTTLLNLSLKLIEKVKKKYNITKIELQDNSTKKCNNIEGTRIDFSKMSILMSGDTWYGKYGFLPEYPFDESETKNENKKKTKELIEKYKKNKNIMEHVKIRDVKKLKEILLNAIEKANVTETLKANIILLYEDCYKDNDLVKIFIKTLLQEPSFRSNKKNDGTCVVFSYFYKKLFKMLNLCDFHGKKFIKKI